MIKYDAKRTGNNHEGKFLTVFRLKNVDGWIMNVDRSNVLCVFETIITQYLCSPLEPDDIQQICFLFDKILWMHQHYRRSPAVARSILIELK